MKVLVSYFPDDFKDIPDKNPSDTIIWMHDAFTNCIHWMSVIMIKEIRGGRVVVKIRERAILMK